MTPSTDSRNTSAKEWVVEDVATGTFRIDRTTLIDETVFEREMASVNADYKELEASYGDDMLLLVIASGYLERLIGKPEIHRFLAGRYPEFLDNFRAIVTATSLDQTGVAA